MIVFWEKGRRFRW